VKRSLESSLLECADLSALWSVATCRDLGSKEFRVPLRRQAAEDQSGDRSPHSKELRVNPTANPRLELANAFSVRSWLGLMSLAGRSRIKTEYDATRDLHAAARLQL
jgi:hypothetical protein